MVYNHFFTPYFLSLYYIRKKCVRIPWVWTSSPAAMLDRLRTCTCHISPVWRGRCPVPRRHGNATAIFLTNGQPELPLQRRLGELHPVPFATFGALVGVRVGDSDEARDTRSYHWFAWRMKPKPKPELKEMKIWVRTNANYIFVRWFFRLREMGE